MPVVSSASIQRALLCVALAIGTLFAGLGMANAGEIAICANIKNYMAQESAKSISAACSGVGVQLSQSAVEKWFRGALTSEQASPGECLATCATLKALKNTEMDACIHDTLTMPFIKGMLEAGVFNENGCRGLGSRL